MNRRGVEGVDTYNRAGVTGLGLRRCGDKSGQIKNE